MNIFLPIRLLMLAMVLCTSGCAIATYTQYAGQQQKWPIAQGSFVSNYDGILIYRGLPDRPYTLMGEVVIDQYPQYMNASIAHAAHVHKADAAMIVGKEVVNGGVMNVGGGGTTYYQGQSTTGIGGGLLNTMQTGTATTIANPTYAGAISWDRTSVYLIKFISQ